MSTIRCKRIIDGKSYNTETSVLLGRADHDGALEEALFKTRHGAYFFHVDLYNEPDERIMPVEPEHAQRWMERNCSADALEAEFGQMPEAGESEARLTVRIPETLRRRITALAEGRKQSVNSWILRAIERAAADSEGSL